MTVQGKVPPRGRAIQPHNSAALVMPWVGLQDLPASQGPCRASGLAQPGRELCFRGGKGQPAEGSVCLKEKREVLA